MSEIGELRPEPIESQALLQRARARSGVEALPGRLGDGAAHLPSLVYPSVDGVMNVFQRLDIGRAIGHATRKIGDMGDVTAALAVGQTLDDDAVVSLVHLRRS